MTQQHDAPEGGAASMLDAMGEVIASMMKRDALDHYRRERAMFEAGPVNREEEGYTGHYEGCLAEAESYVERLRRRGYDVVPCSPTPPAPSGLAGRTLVAQMEQTFGSGSVAAWDGSDEKAIVGADATLSGQQGGAVPVGDRWAFAQKVNNRLRWGGVDLTDEQVRDVLDAADALRARLAEQPAPAGTGEAERVEGLQPGIEKALEIVEAERETVSVSSSAYQRLWSVSNALRAALNGASGQETTP